MKLSLLAGKVSASVPEPAPLFTIATEKYSLINKGTRVSVEANSGGDIQAYVHEGSVRFNYVGDGGVTSSNQILKKNEKLTVNQKNETFLETADFSDQFPAVEFPKMTALEVPESYVEGVLRDDPILYWRFEDHYGGTIQNTVSLPGSEMYRGRVTGGKMPLLGEQGNRSWIQVDPEAGVYVSTAEPIKKINEAGYSIELWVSPLEFQRMTLASLVSPEPNTLSPESSNQQHYHLACLELMNFESDYVHPANSFRFLHRWPPGTEGNIGSNIFEPGYLPGRWYHVVAVRSAVDSSGESEQSLYLNGSLISRKLVKNDSNDSGDYEFFIGRLDPTRNERGLFELIDEIALYSRPLTPEEIATHYRLVMPGLK